MLDDFQIFPARTPHETSMSIGFPSRRLLRTQGYRSAQLSPLQASARLQQAELQIAELQVGIRDTQGMKEAHLLSYAGSHKHVISLSFTMNKIMKGLLMSIVINQY